MSLLKPVTVPTTLFTLLGFGCSSSSASFGAVVGKYDVLWSFSCIMARTCGWLGAFGFADPFRSIGTFAAGIASIHASSPISSSSSRASALAASISAVTPAKYSSSSASPSFRPSPSTSGYSSASAASSSSASSSIAASNSSSSSSSSSPLTPSSALTPSFAVTPLALCTAALMYQVGSLTFEPFSCKPLRIAMDCGMPRQYRAPTTSSNLIVSAKPPN
mmetsp:Transcript_98672/g.170840  ORF Transcript_98672/g.170840 Transcript_98672/m.170840 type:complete len:219 (+) Transcript_98672:678-1334(+)